MRHLSVLLPALLAVAVAQEHFLDVRALVKDTIEAIKDVPAMMKNQTVTSSASSATSSSNQQPELTTVETSQVAKAKSDVYDSFLRLPGDIMSQLARDAGFVDEKKEEKQQQQKKEEERVEKKKEDEESYSFKTVDDLKAEERRQTVNERPTMVQKKVDDNDDIFSISKLISATGNAIREAQAAQAAQQPQQMPQQEPMITLPPLVPLPPAPLPMPALQMPAAVDQPATEIMYRPVTKDGKTVYEQVVVVKEANGSVKLLPNTVLPQLPEPTKRVEIKQVNKEAAAEFFAPTFPPAVNLFDQLTSTTEASTTTTTTQESTTEEPVKTSRRKSLPRRKIQYLEKKAKDMHSRQFGFKTVQMSDPIEIQAQEEQEPVNVLQKEGTLRVHAINSRRKSRKPRVVKVEEPEKVDEKVEEQPEETAEETTEPPKKKRKLMRKVQKKAVKKEIRKFPDLYDEQWKTQVAPSVSPPSEDFAEQFDGIDEVQEGPKKKVLPQNDTPMNDPIEQRSSKVQMFTKEQEEEVLNKEIHKRVLQRIRLSKLKSSEKNEKVSTSTTTTEVPSTEAPKEEEKKEEKKEEKVEEDEEEEDVTDEDDLEEEEEEEVTTTTSTTTTTTTTEVPVTRAERVKKNKKRAVVTKHQCLNLRSFARQFMFDTLEEFAHEHCYFIENYYPALTCARSHLYVAKCQKWLKEN